MKALKVEATAPTVVLAIETTTHFSRTYLFSDLETLYLAGARSYDLRIKKADLKIVEGIFDEIIRRHGIREVEFNYRIVDPSEDVSL